VLAFRGLCDASAIVALDAEHVVIADDETNVLRVYTLRAPKRLRRY